MWPLGILDECSAKIKSSHECSVEAARGDLAHQDGGSLLFGRGPLLTDPRHNAGTTGGCAEWMIRFV
jgi:hypothetical protein